MTGTPLTLRDRLTIRTPLGPPSAIVRGNRERLCAFIRTIEDEVFTADGESRTALRHLLGWDDETFHRFITSPLVTHSSPHTGMNAFPPMLTHPWVQRCIQELTSLAGAGESMHLRTLVMHNNLGDLRWRPYAWWHRSITGSIIKTTFLSRGHTMRRRPMLAQPVPQIDLSECVGSDRDALALARHGRNYAYMSAIYRMHLERLAEFHLPHGTIEVPMNVVNAFTFTTESLADWVGLAEDLSARRVRTIDPAGELADLSREEAVRYTGHTQELGRFPIVSTNAQNFAQVYQFGITVMIGAEKMALYTGPMHEEIDALFRRLGWSYPFPKFIPITRIPDACVAPVDEPSRQALRAFGIRNSLPICVADHGAGLAARLDPLLSCDYAEFSPPLPAIGDKRLAAPPFRD
ncbi:MAG TPA: hypothetical protein VGQ10_16850 [Vicinamibacterales bacterium]|nr:hypothetical protein [Vicinamibacterales bacterium]